MNCKFDPSMSLETVRLMKEALDKDGLNCHLMIQPVGYHTPDAGRTGFSSLPELPFGKNTPDMITRLKIQFLSRGWDSN